MSGERGTCAACGRDVGVRVPKGGDGSAVYPYGHRDQRGFKCAGRYSEARRADTPTQVNEGDR